MNKQFVSIIIPTFNRGHLINEALNSVLEQTHTNWECIVVDDGSTDNTSEVLKSYCNQDKRFHFYKRPDNRPKGANACRNYGFEKSKGDFVNWFDSDDVMKPNFLESKLELMKEDLDAVFSYGAYFKDDILAYEISKPKIDGTVLDFIKGTFYLSTPGPLWNRSFLLDKMLFDEYRQKIQDIEFHFRRLIEDLNFVFYESDFLFFIRRGEERISSKSGLTTRKLQDVFEYHYSTLNNSDKIPEHQVEEYIEVTSKKTLAGLYESFIFEDNILKRIKVWQRCKSKTVKTINSSKKSFSKKMKIYLGIFMTIVAKKGYKLMTV
jgi:glycosyltransferase involved in cell wall biosynthesis